MVEGIQEKKGQSKFNLASNLLLNWVSCLIEVQCTCFSYFLKSHLLCDQRRVPLLYFPDFIDYFNAYFICYCENITWELSTCWMTSTYVYNKLWTFINLHNNWIVSFGIFFCYWHFWIIYCTIQIKNGHVCFY